MKNINLIPFLFQISNVSNDSADIYIDGNIVDAQTQSILKSWFGDETSVSFKSFRDNLQATDVKTYNIYINSGGGNLIDAMAMHDLLIDMQSKGKIINTIGTGIIASAATYILMASNNPEMTENSWFMIHNVSGLISGTVDEIESYGKVLRKFNNSARDFYASRTGSRPEDITKAMNAETWYTAKEAKDNNFIKKVSGKAAFKNTIAANEWQFTNTNVLNAYNSFANKLPEEIEILNLINNKPANMKKTFLQDILNVIKGVKPEATATPSEIVNSIVTALQTSFDALPEDPAPVDNTQVITEAVTNALKPYEIKFTNLEKLNNETRTENKRLVGIIENAIGKPTNTVVKPENEVKVVGSFGDKVVR